MADPFPAVIRRNRLGDGDQLARDEADFLIGQTIARIEGGALSAERYWHLRMLFESGDGLLMGPRRLGSEALRDPHASRGAQPGDMVVGMAFIPGAARRTDSILWVPGA